MIEAHWGLDRKPFSNSPDPAFIYHAPAFEEGFARLLYDVTEIRGGLSLVTGGIGCGKTMLAHALIERLAETPYAAAVLATPRLTPVQLLAAVAGLLGSASVPRAKHALVIALGDHLRQLHADGRRPVLIVDEAQLVPQPLLEEIRLLTNYEDRTDKHLHIVLLGQPELRDHVLARPQIDQRIGLRHHLTPLDPDEVCGYVEHRLTVAGSSRPRRTFARDAVQVLAERSKGVPRMINNLATQAMFVGALRRLTAIDAELVAAVADEREGDGSDETEEDDEEVAP
jgi:type II secretory pathway predicted ATPase ExeA